MVLVLWKFTCMFNKWNYLIIYKQTVCIIAPETILRIVYEVIIDNEIFNAQLKRLKQHQLKCFY